MLKRKYLKFSFELIFLLLIIAGGWKALESRKYSPLYEADEVAWIFAGYYFNLYFLQFNLFHEDWNDDEAFDHPPLAKYIVGGTLYLKGYTIDSLDPKRFWNAIPPDKFPIFFDFVKHKIPNPNITIPFSRSIIFVFALSSLLLIYIFIRSLYGALPAVICTSLIISCPIHNYYSIAILADPILLFFYALFILFCALYWKSQKMIYLFFAFVVSSLAFLTKINGIVLVFLLMTIFLIKNRFSILKQDYKCLIMGFIAFLLISIFLNPVFLNTGIKALGKMIEVRLSAFRMLQETFKDAALLSVGERFITAAKVIFFRSSFFYPMIRVPVELIMFLLGMYYIVSRRDFLLMLIFGYMVVIPITILPYPAPRYFYWISPFIYMIGGLSVKALEEMMGKKMYRFLKAKTNFQSCRDRG
jgi:hypothetical protein